MAYNDFRDDADSAPLADALTKIADITTSSESDPELMRKMLVEIRELADVALNEFNDNVNAALAAFAAKN